MEIICKFAKTCTESKPCHHDKPHAETSSCRYPVSCGGECIPYVPASAPLTDHAKYCRLSKQVGGLCQRIRAMGTECMYDDSNRHSRAYIHSCDTQCARPEKQQPVELPKDPLEELIEQEYARVFIALTTDTHELSKRKLREFAEKVRAL
jgi:hypothetical protein